MGIGRHKVLALTDMDAPFGRQLIASADHVSGPNTPSSFSFSWAVVKGLTR